MSSEIALVRYGLLMAGQPLEAPPLKCGLSQPGHFWGTLFESRQELPLENGARHYPVAILNPPRVKIRCEISFHQVSDVKAFWVDLFERELCYPHLTVEKSLMNLTYTAVFLGDGSSLTAPVFVLNPIFCLFNNDRYGMKLTEVGPDRDGFVSWRDVLRWASGELNTDKIGHHKKDHQ